MYTPCTLVEAIPNASIRHLALRNRDFGHTYDRSHALVKALGGWLARSLARSLAGLVWRRAVLWRLLVREVVGSP
jgi:hypothetical protein